MRAPGKNYMQKDSYMTCIATLIGASLSEPHTSESDSAPMSVCLVRTSYRICVQNSIFAYTYYISNVIRVCTN